jgi:hypothetical protein
LQFAPSFDYSFDGETHEIDFAVISSDGVFSREVDMIFGESKSGTALKEDERRKLRSFGEWTGSYICFCTLADDFDETDKAFFVTWWMQELKSFCSRSSFWRWIISR